MSAGRKKGVRYRRRVIRGVKKTFINLVFAPARIPKIKQDTVDVLMKLCEIAAVGFVAALVAHMASPEFIRTGVVVVFGIAFVALIGAIKLSDYQEKIEQYRYYGFRI